MRSPNKVNSLMRLSQSNVEEQITNRNEKTNFSEGPSGPSDKLSPKIKSNNQQKEEKKGNIKKVNKPVEKETTSIQIDAKVLKTIRIYSKLANVSMSSIIQDQLEKFIKTNRVKEELKRFIE